MASGIARGARSRGKRIAFGDGKRIIWGPHAAEIFRDNPNVARPGSERDRDIEWVTFYKGCRAYNKQVGDRWMWNYDFRPIPGEVFLSDAEICLGQVARGSILIEPNVPQHKTCSPNKQWPVDRYQRVADELRHSGHVVSQLIYPGARHRLAGVRYLLTETFRQALAALSQSRLYVGPEGGMHHGAAAVGVPAVVIFGSWIPPEVTGYDSHVNVVGTDRSHRGCGILRRCDHCRRSLDSITVDRVLDGVYREIRE